MAFQPLFSIIITHTYFADKTCRALHFTPTDATVKLMQQFGLLFKKNANGFSLFTDKQSSKNSSGEIMLQFEITCTDSNFFYYTDLADGKPGCMAYHTNNLSNVEKDGITRLARLSNATNNILTVALGNLTGVVKEKDECEFEINFTAKATRWRYLLINKSNSSHNNLIIGNREIAFTKPVEVTLLNGDKALLFSSGDLLLQLSEYNHHHFSLSAIDPTVKQPEKSIAIIQYLPEPTLQTDNFITGFADDDCPTSDTIIII